MATIITKNSSTASSVPLAAQLVQGELAVNVTDKRLFTENNGGTVVELGTNPSSLSTGALAYTGTLTGGTGVVNLGSGQFYKNASGNVGIGTTTAVGRLTSEFNAAGTVTNTLTLNNNAAGAGNGVAINFYASNTSQPFTGRINSLDDGNFGYHTVFSNKVGGSSGAGALTERMRIDSSGNLLVGTTSALSQTGRATFVSTGNALITQVGNGTTAFQSTNTSGTSAYYAAIWGNNGNSFSTCGTIQVSGSNTSYNTSSDYRLKEDVQPMTGALAKVALLKPVTYKWKSDGTDSEGFIAHELAEVCPQAVSGEKDALKEDGSIMPQGIDTSFLVATLTAAIQEQQTIITALTARITALEAANV